jgi:hypothetical protein
VEPDEFVEPVQSDASSPVLFEKILLFSSDPNQIYKPRRLVPHEGRIAIVTDAGWDAVDAAASSMVARKSEPFLAALILGSPRVIRRFRSRPCFHQRAVDFHLSICRRSGAPSPKAIPLSCPGAAARFTTDAGRELPAIGIPVDHMHFGFSTF